MAADTVEGSNVFFFFYPFLDCCNFCALCGQQGTVSGTEWSDGTLIKYAFANLDTLLPRGNCVYLDTKGKWQSKSCTEPLEGALCYKPMTSKL